MKLIGLTGGIGMGKSTAGQFLGQNGAAVVDTDVLARDVVKPGSPALEEIRLAFGAGMVSDVGSLRRDRMARLVFADAVARRRLEEILHPPIRRLWEAQAALWRTEGRQVGVVVIPLLFETESAGCFDATVCVACSEATQRERLVPRGWTAEERASRIQAQWPIEMKMSRADHVVWTEGSLEAHQEQLQAILDHLRASASTSTNCAGRSTFGTAT